MLQGMTPAKKTTRRRRKPNALPATWEYDVEPDWQPLINHVGPLLVAWFMHMGGGRLTDGSFVHAYKHINTRRYFHIHDDGRCFVYDGDGSGTCTFIPVPRRSTIFPVFEHYGFYPSDEDEFEAYRGAVIAAEYLAYRRDEAEEEAPEIPASGPRGDAAAPARFRVAEVLPWSGDDGDTAEDVA